MLLGEGVAVRGVHPAGGQLQAVFDVGCHFVADGAAVLAWPSQPAADLRRVAAQLLRQCHHTAVSFDKAAQVLVAYGVLAVHVRDCLHLAAGQE